jgi:transposase
MRGSDERSGSLFSYVDLEGRVRRDHPLRTIREIANAALADLTGEFAELYPPRLGRPSIAPERLLRAMLLQAFYGLRSERQLMERMEFDLLFRWFVGLGVDDPVWDHSSFSKNRDRLLAGEIAAKFLTAVVAQPQVKRSNESHRSLTDPQARLYRKGDGQPAKLCYMGHALMENRNGLAVGGIATLATGTAEREAALALIDRACGSTRRITLGADKAYDVAAFVAALRARSVSPHIAIDGHVRVTGKPRKTSVDGRVTRHSGYAVSQRCRKRIEEVFGWIKSSAGLAKVKLRGRDRVDAAFTLALAAYNLIRLPKLLAASA